MNVNCGCGSWFKTDRIIISEDMDDIEVRYICSECKNKISVHLKCVEKVLEKGVYGI